MIVTLHLLLILSVLAEPAAPPPPVALRDLPAPLAAMEAELGRLRELKGSPENAPYYVAYQIHDEAQVHLGASWGAIVADTSSRSRVLDIDLRIGSYGLDSSHALRGDAGGGRDAGGPTTLPLEDDPLALRQVIWRETDTRLKEAIENLSRVKAGLAVKADAEDRSDDFSPDEARVDIRPVAPLQIDRTVWAERLRRSSRVFLESPHVYESSVALDASGGGRYFASSEGTRIAFGDPQARVMVYAATRAEDGMELFRYEGWEARDPALLPTEEAIAGAARKVMGELEALRHAPLVEPFTGPAILSGRAAAVFFHEIFGHRIEGHRQKSDDEGQTFTKRIGQPVLPTFLSVVDDPTLRQHEGTDLMGAYPYDDEGIPSEPATVVKDGILKGFLMSRSPVAGFSRSNGHGRRQAGYDAVGRQGNLKVESRHGQTDAELRSQLRALLKKQGKPFGLYFADISGGYTFTTRDAPQAYKVLPLMVYRVYADGREDELVRGVDIVGTPLASFGKIVATGAAYEVFNGYCGAESGYVPVSAIAPAILVSEMEIEKRAKGVERPPILPAPTLTEERR